MYEGTAVFILFMAMLWNLVFSMIGGLKTIPIDIKEAAQVFRATGFNKLRYVTLPAIFPFIVTGSLLAWGSSWTIIIVAEVLHTYIPNSSASNDLFGLGSLLVNAAYQGNNIIFLVALAAMIATISLMNFFIWQKLLHVAERYKFD
jgi:NitT/TauT family transport system permease protein